MFLLVCDINVINLKFDRHKQPSHALHDTKIENQYYQMRHTTDPQYLETFNNKVSVIESYEGSMGTETGLAKDELVVLMNL